jgi:hypothetical protein
VEAISRQLHARREPGREIVHEWVCSLCIAATDEPREHQLRVRILADPRPEIAVPKHTAQVLRDVLAAGVTEAPNFITLNALRWDVANVLIVKRFARSAEIDEQFGDGVNRRADHARRAPEAVSLYQRLNDLDSLGRAQLVHELIMRERSRTVKLKRAHYRPLVGQGKSADNA